MNNRKYEGLEKMRKDIAKDREKLKALEDQIHAKEEKLREAEATVVVANVEAAKLSPEQIGAILELYESGQIRLSTNSGAEVKAYAAKKAVRFEKEDTLPESVETIEKKEDSGNE